MIQYVTRAHVNIEKYNNCISNAVNSRIYAYSWYLDIVAEESWDVLVLDDYVAVMPLPKRRKYFINYVFLPSWSQQLGVFCLDNNAIGLVEKFIASIPKKFKLVEVFFNSDNRFNHKNCIRRTNYFLLLNKPYDSLFKNYKKGRKSNVKQALNHKLNLLEAYNHTKIIKLFIVNKGKRIAKKESDYSILNKLIEHGMSLNLIDCIGITNENDKLIGGAFFLKDSKRITYLFSSVNNEGREKQAMSLVINFIINKFSNTDYILDFEGSMIKDIALFFRSFGAEKEEYFHYKKHRFL